MVSDTGIVKLRYRTQDEVLAVAREHKRRGLPMDAIVIDFFHWTMQGDFKFEPRDWPDPEAMVKELKEMGIETVVSVWPTIDERSENFGTMSEMGYLVDADRGNRDHMTWMEMTVFYDATHPGRAEICLGKNVRKTITKKASVVSGWMKQSRSTVLTILIITATMQDRRCNAATYIRWDMQKVFMRA